MIGLRDIASCLLALVLATGVEAQSWEPAGIADIVQRVQANQRKYEALPAFKLSAVVLAYQNAGDAVPNDRGTSTVWKSGKRSRSEHLGMITYQDERLRVLIDPEERMIYLSEPFEVMELMGPSFREDVLATASAIGRSEQADGTHFRLKFPAPAEYDVVEVLFDKQGWLRRIDTYWARPVPLDPGDPRSPLLHPKVVVELAVPQPVDPASVQADPATVVAIRPQGPVALGAWKEYQVFDTRVK